jgi:hypothetical protein
LRGVQRLWPAVVALVAVAALWLCANKIAWFIPGPPGFDVVVTDRAGVAVAHARATDLITPEVAPSPPVGGTLTARATFLARTDGTYTWQLGGSSPSLLRVDGVVVHSPRPGRVAAKEQALTAGLHAIEIVLMNADANGGVAFAVRQPGQPWRSPLAGPGVVVAAPLAAVAQRLGAHPIALVRALDWAPTLVTLFAAVAVAFAVGGARRRRALAYVRALAADPRAQKFGATLALALVIAPMIAPLRAPGFYACHEEESYIVRLIEYDWSIRGGVPMGRWWPDPVFGRGYPFLCLYAPLLYIVATPFLLLGIPSLSTVKLISALLVIVGASATYHTARRRASRPAALLAATLFTYAPYLQTNLWVREDLAESLGFACFPLALLTLERALDADRKKPYADVAFLALALWALGSCHNITAYFSVYFLMLWMILRLALRTVSREGVRRTVAGGALGFLLTVGYAVPAIADAQRVWMERVMTGYYFALANFVPWQRVLFPEPRWGMRTFVGLAGTIAVAGGIAALIARRRFHGGDKLRGTPGVRLLALCGASGVVLALLLATKPLGRPFVKYVPLANYVQFPWRMFLFAGCLAPLCAPAAVDGFLRSARARWIASGACIAAILIALLPWYGPPAPLVRSRLDVQKFLRNLEIDYVTSMNEYLPKTVKRTVPRFGEVVHVVGGAARLVDSGRSPGHYQATVEASEPATLEFNAHWFPGWRARVDDTAQSIGPGYNNFDDGGLTRVRVPAGRHQVTLDYGRTPLRLVCDLISLAALLGVLALLALMLRSRRAEAAAG